MSDENMMVTFWKQPPSSPQGSRSNRSLNKSAEIVMLEEIAEDKDES